MVSGSKDEVYNQAVSMRPLQAGLAAVRERAALALVLLGFSVHALYLNVTAEDAFITFRFARNLARGAGLVWNAGERPVEGYTNFLWLLYSALVIRLGLDPALLTQALGVVASLAALLLIYLFSRRILRLPPSASLAAPALLALSGPFATWAASSMETNLFALLVLLGCYFSCAWVQGRSLPNLLAAQLSLLAATLTRPEGLLVFVVLSGIGLFLELYRPGRSGLRPYLGALLVYLIPFALYFLWRYRYFGYLLPNTYYAKTGGGLPQYLRGAKYSLLFFLLFVLPLAPLPLALLWERGAGNSLRPPRNLAALRAALEKHVGASVCLAVVLVYSVYIVYVGGDYMAMFRFFVPLLPLIYLLAGLLAWELYREVSASPPKRGAIPWILIIAAACTFLQSTPLEQALFSQPWFMHGTYRGVQHERWHVARNHLAGEFFRRLHQDEDESLAVLGIGIIPYVTDMKIYSFHGIVDPEIAHRPTLRPLGEGVSGHEKVDFASVILRRPTYIMVDTGDLYPELQPFPDYPDEIDAFVRRNYELKGAWLEDRANREVGYLMYLELKERADGDREAGSP